MKYSRTVPLYGTLEIKCGGVSDGNPFTERSIYAEISGAESRTVRGFYDGNGVYIVRFMPQKIGEYRFRIYGNFSDKSAEGSFTVTQPENGQHGMVGVSGKYHFAYADGTPYYSAGTTCYVWHLQPSETLQNADSTRYASACSRSITPIICRSRRAIPMRGRLWTVPC